MHHLLRYSSKTFYFVLYHNKKKVGFKNAKEGALRNYDLPSTRVGHDVSNNRGQHRAE